MRVARTMLTPLIFAGAAALGGCGGDPEPSAMAFSDSNGVLTVIAGTFDHDCSNVDALIFQCGRWELAVHLRPAAQSGAVQPIGTDDVWGENIVSDGPADGTDCTVRARPFEQGSISIDEVTDGYVRFTVDGSSTGNFDADGTFEGTVCDSGGPEK